MRDTPCSLEGIKSERLEGILGGSGNLGRSTSHSREPRDGGIVYAHACVCVCVCVCVCARARQQESVSKQEGMRGKERRILGLSPVCISAFEPPGCRDDLPSLLM